MSILVDSNTKVMIQGITGQQASFHVKASQEYGTNIVAGVSLSKVGKKHLGVPVFSSVKEAKDKTGANASVLYVPAKYIKSAMIEAIEAEIDVAVCITDGIPVKDMLEIKSALKGSKTKLIGPNTPGLISPQNKVRMGIYSASIVKKGNVGIVSRSSTLTYEAILETNRAKMGQSTVIGLGDDVLIGQDFVDVIKRFHEDKQTKFIVMIGQLGGFFEEEGAKYYATIKNKKPIIAYVAGNTIPEGSQMGYIGDLIAGSQDVKTKEDVLKKSGIIVVEKINQIHQELLKL
ncbi:MAG: succinate--CoA ligase subunit alpha [Alphaproteobacteria bacterium]